MRILLLRCVALVVGLAGAIDVPGATGATAASKYKACALLTAAELEAVLKKKISKTDEGDVTIPEGPYKGEVMSGCSWIAGETYASLGIARAPRNPKERAEFLAMVNDSLQTLKQQGWSIQEKTIGGVECATARPPKGTSGNPSFAGCSAEKGRLGFSISIMGAGVQVSLEEVKSLADKAAGRIR